MRPFIYYIQLLATALGTNSDSDALSNSAVNDVFDFIFHKNLSALSKGAMNFKPALGIRILIANSCTRCR